MSQTTPTVPMLDVATKLDRILTKLVGEQKVRHIDDDGWIHFGLVIDTTPVSLVVEPLGDSDASVYGFTVIGARVEDLDAARDWVLACNRRIHFGRTMLDEDGDVMFIHHLFSSGVNEASVRGLIHVVAGMANTYPDLAEKTGALSIADLQALNSLED